MVEEEREDIWQVVRAGTSSPSEGGFRVYSYAGDGDVISLNQPRCFSGSHEGAEVSGIQ